MAAFLISSCSCTNEDPDAKTEGYRLFIGNTEGLYISFEYPDTWRRDDIEKHDAWEYFYLLGCKSSYMDISSDVNAANGGEFENARARLEDRLNSFSNLFDEFEILSRGKVLLGNVEGEEAVYSYFFVNYPNLDWHPGAPPLGPDKYVIHRLLAVDYKGRIYSLFFRVDADEYEEFIGDFEHIIATFKFLD
jgi:hypothetical protein